LKTLRIAPLLALLFSSVLATVAHAQGGPPFITDDPVTCGNKHLEVNIGFIADHNPAHASYSTPNLDFNYGIGDRLQLKWEIPLAVATDEHNTTIAGPGNSLFGIKWQLYAHYRAGKPKSDENLTFALGSYPQVAVNNPTSSVRRGVVDSGPQYYLPLEALAKIGWLRLNGEVGRWIGNRTVPERLGRGLIAGHEFSDKLELYSEIYDLSDLSSINNAAKQREFTLDFGGRRTLNRRGNLHLLFMGGRSLHHSNKDNSEPNWIAYLGLQMSFGPKDDEPASAAGESKP